MGGLGGLVASSVPVITFVPVNNRWGLHSGIAAALLVAVAILVWRLVRKENLQPAISGFFGVAIAAGIAWYTGSAKGYFLFGIWISALYAAIFIVSIIVRWPLVGVIWKGINGDGMAWQKNPQAVRAYTWATAGWAVVFAVRFYVQNFFYNSDATNSLAIARLLMGWPLSALVMVFTVVMVRKATAALKTTPAD
ncbi:DUF3159 domain-containing protein [Corynebacterium sp. ES2794-CONJ1]|nr:MULTISPECIES: DUF3159 domain-containing protein [unclassified Corynebacterium]MCS4489202.1 DUF3159 domain-containing protein [Corynebacterium sp. ES2775-CONJ]MCS4491015.1 DUF3159 domain-containing protein [Corynebacterium sp. ES2715-CONJ3]MCS4531104.1 DUF3159 domain-containing protein [Corynebacterium sp. ES2730-CONJ]MCU9518471.1 DUF3159 domain-containing protein [Corynebacterium sp. ES2794-CONJ1]